MKLKKWHLVLIIVAAVVLGAGVGAYAATTYGTQSDPLVTVSYLNETLRTEMTNQFDTQLSQAVEELENRFDNSLASAGGAFKAVTLSSGQTLSASSGCEILYRSGSAAASGSLVDLSGGSAVSSGGSLSANHLYLVSDTNSGVKASGSVSLMVRGTYTIG